MTGQAKLGLVKLDRSNQKFEPKILLAKKFLDPKIFLNLIFLEAKNILGPKYFSDNFFFSPKFFWPKNLLGTYKKHDTVK